MGIEVFVPRFVLPAAKQSVQAELPQVAPATGSTEGVSEKPVIEVAAGMPEAEAQREIDVARPENVAGIVSGIMGELGGQSTQRSKSSLPSEEATQTSYEEPIVHEPVRFTLNIWQASPSLMVIDSHQPRQAFPTAALLTNILFAKQIHQRLPVPESLTWPIFDGGAASSGWVEASSMVQAFLGERMAVSPSRYLWLMGESAYKAIRPSGEDFEQKLGLAIDLPELSCLAIVLPSLREVLLNPELKPLLWRAIRPYDIR